MRSTPDRSLKTSLDSRSLTLPSESCVSLRQCVKSHPQWRQKVASTSDKMSPVPATFRIVAVDFDASVDETTGDILSPSDVFVASVDEPLRACYDVYH